jgi:hypothetical protein
MLMKNFHTRSNGIYQLLVRSTSQNVAKLHEKKHSGLVMDPKFYENDFMAGRGDLEFVRSPFYDLAKSERKMNGEEAGKLFDEVAEKMQAIEGLEIFLAPPIPTKDNVAYTRYADKAEDQSARHLY